MQLARDADNESQCHSKSLRIHLDVNNKAQFATESSPARTRSSKQCLHILTPGYRTSLGKRVWLPNCALMHSWKFFLLFCRFTAVVSHFKQGKFNKNLIRHAYVICYSAAIHSLNHLQRASEKRTRSCLAVNGLGQNWKDTFTLQLPQKSLL